MESKPPKSHMVKVPMAKSSVPRSPMPRSPMPKSPIPKSPVAYEKYKSRCAYGLISFFRFRHRHSKKMISDTDNRCLSRHALDDRQFKSRLDSRSDQYIHDGVDEKTVMVDAGNKRVNKIMRDVCIEQQTKKKCITAKVENVQSDSENVHDQSRKSRKATKTSRRPRRLPIIGCYDVSTVGHANPTVQNLAERSLVDSPESTNFMQCDDLNEINLQVNLNEAAEAFINQKLIDGKRLGSDGASQHSKHFLDALEVLNSNKDLFVKLLQDPNSLLVKHIEDLRDTQDNEQQKESSVKSELLAHHLSTRNEGCTSKENDSAQPSENIVVLKSCQQSLQQCADKACPDSPQIHYGQRNVSRKEEQLLLTDGAVHLKSTRSIEGFEECGRETGAEIISRNSPDNAASDFGGLTTSSMDVNRKYQMDKVNESDPGAADEAGADSERGLKSSCLSADMHVVHIERRVDISELKKENMKFLRKQRAKTWDGITYIPDYDFLPTISSGRMEENGFLSPQRRSSPYNSHQIVSKNQWSSKKNSCFSPLRQNLEALPWAINRKIYETRPNFSDSLDLDVEEHKGISSLTIDSSEIETSNSQNSEEINPTGQTSKLEVPHNNGVNENTKAIDTCKEGGPLAFSRTDSLLENRTSISSLDDYSSSPSNHQTFKHFDVIKDDAEQPSPISVLDQFFTEDVNSPSNAKSQPTPPSMWQLEIDAEECHLAAHQPSSDCNINSSDSIKEYGSVFNYISRVLQTSRLTWDELSSKCCFSDQLLNQSLFDDIGMWPSQCCVDRRLLFDHVNEVVLDAYWCYLRCSPWLSFIKPRILPAILPAESIVEEVMKHVDWSLLLGQPLETLEKIIEMDLNKSGRRMDVQIDAEDAVSEMIDSLLEELAIEIVLQ